MYNKYLEKYKEPILELNDYMANNPEIGSEEFEASKRIVNILRSNNIDVQYPYNKMETSFIGRINKGKSKKVAILTEYDALRGMGHACGHCASGSMSVLAGLILNELKDELDFQIDIIGTPDEEILGGKVFMAEDGLFDDYEFAIMIHMNHQTTKFTPFLALDAFIVEFEGEPAHAAAQPWNGKNALNAMRLTFDAIDMMRQHVKDDVKIHGYIIEGGIASNIVPDKAKAEFLLRSEDRNYLNEVVDWFRDIVKASALATRTKYKLESFGKPFHDLSSKETGENLLEELFTNRGYDVVEDKTPGGSSDIGNVDYIIPAFHPMMGIGKNYAPHTIEFAKEMTKKNVHQAILDGGIIIVEFIMKVMEDPELLGKIKEEHRSNRTGVS